MPIGQQAPHASPKADEATFHLHVEDRPTAVREHANELHVLGPGPSACGELAPRCCLGCLKIGDPPAFLGVHKRGESEPHAVQYVVSTRVLAQAS